MEQLIYESDNPERIMYVMRGLPGSGKSTLAKTLTPHVFCADDFFDVEGICVFNPEKIQEAHSKNRRNYLNAMDENLSPIAIDNTHLRAKDMRRLVREGIQKGYTISLVEPDTEYKLDPEILAEKNTHGIPQEIIEKYLARFQKDLTLERILGPNYTKP